MTPDAHCDAHRPNGLTTPVVAFVSTTTVKASEQLNLSVDYYRPDFVKVGHGFDLANGIARNGLWARDDGSYAAGELGVWTGAALPKVKAVAIQNCNDWSATSGSGIVGEINTGGAGTTWFQARDAPNTRPCTDTSTDLHREEIDASSSPPDEAGRSRTAGRGSWRRRVLRASVGLWPRPKGTVDGTGGSLPAFTDGSLTVSRPADCSSHRCAGFPSSCPNGSSAECRRRRRCPCTLPSQGPGRRGECAARGGCD